MGGEAGQGGAVSHLVPKPGVGLDSHASSPARHQELKAMRDAFLLSQTACEDGDFEDGFEGCPGEDPDAGWGDGGEDDLGDGEEGDFDDGFEDCSGEDPDDGWGEDGEGDLGDGEEGDFEDGFEDCSGEDPHDGWSEGGEGDHRDGDWGESDEVGEGEAFDHPDGDWVEGNTEEGEGDFVTHNPDELEGETYDFDDHLTDKEWPTLTTTLTSPVKKIGSLIFNSSMPTALRLRPEYPGDRSACIVHSNSKRLIGYDLRLVKYVSLPSLGGDFFINFYRLNGNGQGLDGLWLHDFNTSNPKRRTVEKIQRPIYL